LADDGIGFESAAIATGGEDQAPDEATGETEPPWRRARHGNGLPQTAARKQGAKRSNPR
jgi:hypothetical protein